MLPFGMQADGVPFIRCDPDIGGPQLLAPAIDHAIEADIVLKRVGAGDVVIVGILKPHRNASGLIALARDRLEANFNVKIFGGQAFMDRERKTIVGAFGAGLLDRAPRRRRRVCDYGPLAVSTPSRAGKGESGWR